MAVAIARHRCAKLGAFTLNPAPRSDDADFHDAVTR
jgi:hypothetical protein